MKIYTKSGDKGKTSLLGGQRVDKDNLRIEAYGTADELNAFIAQLISVSDDATTNAFLISIQNKIFTIGSMLSLSGDVAFEIPRITLADVERIENEIDLLEADLEPLKNFILPPGHPIVSACHICRTVSRRTERRIISLHTIEDVDPLILMFFNRLSDYLFVLSRWLSKKYNVKEQIWKSNI